MGVIIPTIINGALGAFNRLLMIKVHYGLRSHYRRIMRLNGISNRPVAGEDDYLKKWKRLSRLVAVEDYRLFSNYIQPSADLVPEAVSHNIVEAILNPIRYRPYYADKNMFDKIMPDGFMPPTCLRRINGFYYDADYKPLIEEKIKLDDFTAMYNRIVIKPTVDSCSGRNVTVLVREKFGWKALNNSSIPNNLTIQNLSKIWGDNFIVQKCMGQSNFMNYFCPTSVNSIRLFVYRSIKNDESVVPAAVIRVGHKGACVDNIHQGGLCVGVYPDGSLANYGTNTMGQRFTKINDVDLEKEHFVIPNFENVLAFAKRVGERITHCRMSNIDVMLDENNQPHLIEYNLTGMSTWLYQFEVCPAYGIYADEIIEYCAKYLRDASHLMLEY